MKSVRIVSLGLLFALAAPQVMAARYDVSVQNLSSGSWFTPLLVSAHPEELSVFESGEPASAELEAIAEVGDISALQSVLTSAGADVIANPGMGVPRDGRGWECQVLRFAPAQPPGAKRKTWPRSPARSPGPVRREQRSGSSAGRRRRRTDGQVAGIGARPPIPAQVPWLYESR